MTTQKESVDTEATGPMDLSDILNEPDTSVQQDHFPALGHSLEWEQHHEIPLLDRLDGYTVTRQPHYVTLAQLFEAVAFSLVATLSIMLFVVFFIQQ